MATNHTTLVRLRDNAASKKKYTVGEHWEALPPFFKADVPIVVHIDLVEEPRQPPRRHGETGPLKSSLQLALVQPPILVAIYRSEEKQKMPLGLLYKNTELWGAIW